MISFLFANATEISVSFSLTLIAWTQSKICSTFSFYVINKINLICKSYSFTHRIQIELIWFLGEHKKIVHTQLRNIWMCINKQKKIEDFRIIWIDMKPHSMVLLLTYVCHSRLGNSMRNFYGFHFLLRLNECPCVHCMEFMIWLTVIPHEKQQQQHMIAWLAYDLQL